MIKRGLLENKITIHLFKRKIALHKMDFKDIYKIRRNYYNATVKYCLVCGKSL